MFKWDYFLTFENVFQVVLQKIGLNWFPVTEGNGACHGDETLMLFKWYDIPLNTR